MAAFARFISSGRHFSTENRRVKRTALMPALNEALGRYETSVFFYDGATDDEMWPVGDRHLPKPPVALGRSSTHAIEKQGLAVDRDDQPPKHGAIVGWPHEKQDQIEASLRLDVAGCFALVVRQH